MSLLKVIEKIGEVIVNGVATVINGLMTASPSGLMRFGIVAGVAIGTAFLVYKYAKDKKKSYTMEPRTEAEKSLALNYHDARVQRNALSHPSFNSVRKALNKDARNRNGKNGKYKFHSDYIRRCAEDVGLCPSRRYGRNDEYDILDPTPEYLRSLEYFKNNYEELKKDRPARYHGLDYDHGHLRRVWEGCFMFDLVDGAANIL